MPPFQQPTASAEDYRLNLGDEKEVLYWTRFFQCTELELRNAIALMGPLLLAVWRGLLLLRAGRLA